MASWKACVCAAALVALNCNIAHGRPDMGNALPVYDAAAFEDHAEKQMTGIAIIDMTQQQAVIGSADTGGIEFNTRPSPR